MEKALFLKNLNFSKNSKSRRHWTVPVSMPHPWPPAQCDGSSIPGRYGWQNWVPLLTLSSPIGWMPYIACGGLGILTPGCPYLSWLVGKTMDTGRGGLRSPRTTVSTQCTACTVGKSLWERRATVPTPSFGAVTWKRTQERETVH